MNDKGVQTMHYRFAAELKRSLVFGNKDACGRFTGAARDVPRPSLNADVHDQIELVTGKDSRDPVIHLVNHRRAPSKLWPLRPRPGAESPLQEKLDRRTCPGPSSG